MSETATTTSDQGAQPARYFAQRGRDKFSLDLLDKVQRVVRTNDKPFVGVLDELRAEREMQQLTGRYTTDDGSREVVLADEIKGIYLEMTAEQVAAARESGKLSTGGGTRRSGPVKVSPAAMRQAMEFMRKAAEEAGVDVPMKDIIEKALQMAAAGHAPASVSFERRSTPAAIAQMTDEEREQLVRRNIDRELARVRGEQEPDSGSESDQIPDGFEDESEEDDAAAGDDDGPTAVEQYLEAPDRDFPDRDLPAVAVVDEQEPEDGTDEEWSELGFDTHHFDTPAANTPTKLEPTYEPDPDYADADAAPAPTPAPTPAPRPLGKGKGKAPRHQGVR